MRSLNTFFTSLALFLLPFVSSAQLVTGGDAGGVNKFFTGLLTFINSTLIPFVLGLAFLMFIWGVFKYFILGGAEEEKQKEGKQLMLYAAGGFLLIVIFYGLINVLSGAIGIDQNSTINIPEVPSAGARSGA